MKVAGKKVAVIGAARTGLAAAKFLTDHGAEVFLNDLKEKDSFSLETLSELEAQGVKYIFGRHADLEELEVELLIMSPGVPLSIPPVVQARKKKIPVWSEMELASRYTKAPMVVVTGTNGKTTTTSLLGQIFTDFGKNTFVAGNIGVPFISRAEELGPQEVAVLEASSFQLEATGLFKPRVALILNITPDHIDRHGSLAGYIEAKAKIFVNQDQDDWLVLNWDDDETRKLAARAKSRVLLFSRQHNLKEGLCVEKGFLTVKLDGQVVPVIRPEEIYIRGSHNLENALAAVAAGWVMGVSAESLRNSLRTFPGVAHRLEPVATIKGVSFVNDSKGTNPDASIKALEAFEAPIVLIAGGKSKGSDFLPFARLIKERVKAVVLIGQAAGEIEEVLRIVDYANYRHAGSMEEAVEEAFTLADSGEIVLLSPACASFDMFDHFEHRGDAFKEVVLRLAAN